MRSRLWKYPLVFYALLLGTPVPSWADTVASETMGPERITWKKTPIEVSLTVGEEQRIDFPGPVQVGVPVAIQSLLRVQSVAGTVYLLAHQSFEATRMMVRAVDNGAIYLLDLSADSQGLPTATIQILDPEMATLDVAAEGEKASPTFPSYGYVALTRFAAQQLYAPARVLRNWPGVVRVPVRREPVDLLRGDQVEARPLVAWRAGDLFITGVRLQNLSTQAVTLDPRTLRGGWLTAAFQHSRLHPAGDEADTTALYLISARSFERSL